MPLRRGRGGGRRCRSGSALMQRHLGERDGGQDAAEDVVGADVVGQRLVREHDAVAQDVEGEVVHVLRAARTSRPRTNASALAARIMLIEARGLAPKVM